MNLVILVNEKDEPVGVMEKIEAHKRGGTLHRAFSILVFNKKGELMLQLRSKKKYHAGGLWTNTVCSHPRPGETTEEAAKRRLQEEMGFTTDLKEVGSFIYRADVGNGLTEYEYDHVFVGFYEGLPKPNPEEADGWKWMDFDAVVEDVKRNPETYTPWFRILLDEMADRIREELR
jgi:isopentenyl-diphosphate delta-isomerase